MTVPYYGTGKEIPSPRLVAAWYRIDDLATEQVPLWAAHWLASGMDGEALRILAGMDGSDPPSIREILPDALANTRSPVPSDLGSAVNDTYKDLARLHLAGQLSAQRLIAKVEQLVVSADDASDFLDPPLGAIYGFHDEWGSGWGRADSELVELLHESCMKQTGQLKQ